MKEIKFRGKRIDNSEWVFGSLVINKHSGIHSIFLEESKLVTLGNIVPVEEKSVGQFTGLTDKNGAEIYEGDICNHYGRFGVEKGVIKFVRYGFHVVLNGGYMFKIDEFYLEVIGNIYENSDLLK